MFKILKKDTKSAARLGILTVPRGASIETPAYVIVGTHAAVRTLSPADLASTGTGIVIANTYHLWRARNLETFRGLNREMNFPGITMTDSGGFQVFSLGFSREHGVGKVSSIFPGSRNLSRTFRKYSFLPDLWLEIRSRLGIRNERNSVRITPSGTYFLDEGYGDVSETALDARRSIFFQEQIGADIILAFDECTSPDHGYWYTRWAMGRTHRWAKASLAAKAKGDQLLYGIVQGGAYSSLRTASAKFIGSLPFGGFAIGGSLGDSHADMLRVLDLTVPHLPDDKPRHLLGIGKIEDLFDGVERGVDTFDCVIPTREGRHGCLWTPRGRVNARKGANKGSTVTLEELNGDFPTHPELRGVTVGELYELFSLTPEAREERGEDPGRLATIQNVLFFNTLMSRIRDSIREDRFFSFKGEFLGGLRNA